MENKIVDEQPIEKAQEELKQDTVAPTGDEEILSKVEELTKTTEELQKAYQKKTEEADNYKKGMLKAKGKLKDAGYEDEDEPNIPQISEERIAQIVEERIKAMQPVMESPKDELLEKSMKVNSELITALKNRSQISSSATGSNMDKPEPKTENYLSPTQEADLTARATKIGLDPKKYIADFKKNLQQVGVNKDGNGMVQSS